MSLPGKGTGKWGIRLRPSLRALLEMLAGEHGESTRGYVRRLLEEHVWREVKSRVGPHPGGGSFDRSVKRFLLAQATHGYGTISVAGSLPGKGHRDSLEDLAWRSLEEAVAYAKAQTDPQLRLLAMRVATVLMRAELAILHEQDQAAIDELLEDLEAKRRELAEKAREAAEKAAS